MGKWLAEFQNNMAETGKSYTDNTDVTCVLSVMSVHQPRISEEISGDEIIERWNPELDDEGYVWCLDCKYLNSVCTHKENPFPTRCIRVARKCQWFSKSSILNK